MNPVPTVNRARREVGEIQKRIVEDVTSNVFEMLDRYPFLREYTQAMGAAFFTLLLDGEELTVDLLHSQAFREVEQHFQADDVEPPDPQLKRLLARFELDCAKLKEYHIVWGDLFQGALCGEPLRISRQRVLTHW